ncbi:MAG: glycosyltransferase family 4 protein [Candidatus Pacearchaeota archaeon]|jgi:glycosyltransferase involved in cell wall biosynthesis
MKNILMIGLTPPLEGGSERHIYEISSRISEAVVLTQEGSICKNKIELRVSKKSVFIRNITFLISSFFYSFILLFTFKKKYNIIHIHENLLYILAPFLRIRYKVIVTVHGIKGFKFHDNKYLWFFFRQFLKFPHQLIAVNLEDKETLLKYFDNVSYVPNGVDLSLYNSKTGKIENKIEFIGRIHEQKGIIYLLEAFQEISKKFPQFKLEIIGEVNDYAKELQLKFKNKNILWRGYLSDRKEIVKSLKSAYCITLPSLWEGLPLTLFESLASSRPLIISDIPAFKSVIKDEAVFFKSKDSKDLADKILLIIKNKKLAETYALKGKNLSKSYDWNNIARQTIDLYEK